jgi:hypothetical protein
VIEADIDKHFAEAVSAAGGVGKRIAYRGERGASDWLVGFPFNRLFLVELKRPKGGRIRRAQLNDAQLWMHVGVEKVWLRTIEEVNRWIKKVRA